MDKLLTGKKIAVIVESKFIPEEITVYQNVFKAWGADVRLISRIWYNDFKPGAKAWKKPTFWSDVDVLDAEPWETPSKLVIDDYADVSVLKVDEYAAIIMSANYTSVRLRYENFDLNNIPNDFNAREFARQAPIPRFFAEAMKRPNVVKGALCHGLWILTPFPELLKDRNVICNVVVMADILNTGANIVMRPNGVVVDNDLVTGYSKHETFAFCEAIADQILIKQNM